MPTGVGDAYRPACAHGHELTEDRTGQCTEESVEEVLVQPSRASRGRDGGHQDGRP
jgi:hypothetical protein